MAEQKTRTNRSEIDERAKQAVDPETRHKAQARALADHLEQQEQARGDVPDAGEQSHRAAHSAEGGGAWPEDLLKSKFLSPAGSISPAFSPELNYTSHEKQD